MLIRWTEELTLIELFEVIQNIQIIQGITTIIEAHQHWTFIGGR